MKSLSLHRSFVQCILFAVLGFLTGCDKGQPAPTIPEKKSSFQKIVFTQPQTGNTISLVSDTECEIANRGHIILAEYSRQDNKLRIVIRSGGGASVSYFDLLPDGLRADGEMFLSSEVLNKMREQARLAQETEEAKRAEKRAAEMRAAEQAKEEKRNILENGRKLIIGSWRDEDSTTTYNADGTRQQDIQRQHNDGTWSLDGDILTSLRSVLNGERAPATIRVQLLQLKADKLVIKDQDGKEWHAVRIK